MKVLVILAMLSGIAVGPLMASGQGCATAVKACAGACCHDAASCCAINGRTPEQPAPVHQRVGQDLATAVAVMPVSVLFTLAPPQARRAPRELFGHGHSLAPLAASCIRLI